MSSVMNLVSQIVADTSENRKESQPTRKPESQTSKAKSQKSQKSQEATGKTHKVNTKRNSCPECKHKETQQPHGDGCVYKTYGTYEDIWTLIDKLDGCPRGKWN